jgi:exodeoxyribonuclease VII large subunit
VESKRAVISNVAGRLNALSPLATLSRGYAVARSASGETLSSAAQFEKGQQFVVQLRDGKVAATADSVLIQKTP